MAGGSGTRLWPLSRKSLPKQFLDLGTGKTLLEHTYDRALKITDAQHIYIATTHEYHEKIQSLSSSWRPPLSDDRIFIEPERRETAPAFAAAATQLVQRGQEDTPTLFMWADHVFTNEEALLRDLVVMRDLIEKDPNRIVIIGHTPVTPETGFGYMKMEKVLPGYTNAYEVDSFKEKPDLETAKQYVKDGVYFWNIGYICVTPGFLLKELAVHAPELSEGIKVYAQALKEGEAQAVKAYAQLPKVAIDYALNEKTKHIVAVTGDYGWSDVGSWQIVKELFGTDGDHVPHGHHIYVDSSNNYIYNATHKAVSLIGISDAIIVVTDDAVLVTNEKSSQKVKEVVQKLEQDNKHQYL